MGNVYSSPTISGYNDTPPTDDGANTSANEVTWAKHKTKLADPIKTYADAISSAVTTAFGKVFLNSIETKSTTYTVVSGDLGKLIACTGTWTLTLLAAATAGNGFQLAILNNGAGVITVDGNSAETVLGSATVTLNPGDLLLIVCDGSNWIGALLPNIKGDISLQSNLTVSGAIIGSAVSNYNNAGIDYVKDDSASATVFDVDSAIGGAWESVGPTGSSATNIWTALDSVPSTAKYVKLKIDITGSSSTNTINYALYGRATGSALTNDASTAIARCYNYTVGGTTVGGGSTGVIEVAVDGSTRFDLYATTSGSYTMAVNMTLIGWGT